MSCDVHVVGGLYIVTLVVSFIIHSLVVEGSMLITQV